MGLAGRTALLTGASGGIGTPTARRLLARGVNVVLVDVDQQRVEAQASALGAGALPVVADVTDLAAMRTAVATAVERFGRLDIVVANAGVVDLEAVETADPAAFDRVLEINLRGVWRTVRAALPEVRSQRGYVLCVASLAAVVHIPLMAAYNASKAGVLAFADTLRGEVTADGVDVGTALFSFVDTPLLQQARDDALTALVARRFGGRRELALGPPISPETAAEALLTAIVRRRRQVVRPRIMAPMAWAPAPIQRLVEQGAARLAPGRVARERAARQGQVS